MDMEWVSVADKLPEFDRHCNSVDVIFYASSLGTYVGYRRYTSWVIKLPGGEIRFPHDNKYITHWMYLKSPK